MDKIEVKNEHEQQINQKRKSWAIASLVCSIIGGTLQVVSILAIIFGHIALVKIKKEPSRYTGKKIAIAGLILGYLGLIIGIVSGVMRGYALNVFTSLGY